MSSDGSRDAGERSQEAAEMLEQWHSCRHLVLRNISGPLETDTPGYYCDACGRFMFEITGADWKDWSEMDQWTGIVRVGDMLWNLNNIIRMWALSDDAVMVVYNQIRVTSTGGGAGDTEPYQEMIQGPQGRALARWIKAYEDASRMHPKQLPSPEWNRP